MYYDDRFRIKVLKSIVSNAENLIVFSYLLVHMKKNTTNENLQIRLVEKYLKKTSVLIANKNITGFGIYTRTKRHSSLQKNYYIPPSI